MAPGTPVSTSLSRSDWSEAWAGAAIARVAPSAARSGLITPEKVPAGRRRWKAADTRALVPKCVLRADVADARFGEADQVARVEPDRVAMVAAGAQDGAPVEQLDVDDLGQRQDRRKRADVEVGKPVRDLLLRRQPQVARRAEQ